MVLQSSYTPAPGALFKVGEKVTVVENSPPGHRRTPGYIRGKTGMIERICGAFANPEELAYGFTGFPEKILYRVKFFQMDIWPGYEGSKLDILEIEIYEHWLRKC